VSAFTIFLDWQAAEFVIAEHTKGIGTHPDPVLLKVHDERYPLQSECVVKADEAKAHYFI
jgi:hypothetical protein